MGVLPDRAVIAVTGDGRTAFLDGLLTCDMDKGGLLYGALLTPQGKIVSDMMVHVLADRVAMDVPAAAADDLVRRLTMYRLRAPVAIERTAEVATIGEGGAADPRAPDLGMRGIAASAEHDEDALRRYAEARIAHGVPDAVTDFALGEPFPHEVNMDLTAGVDFHKGCFVGQEVVSRMRHRGTARRRTVVVTAETALPETGADVLAGERVVGRLGTVSGSRGLATVRIDRVGEEALVGGVAVRLAPPPGAPFTLADVSRDGADEGDAGASA